MSISNRHRRGPNRGLAISLLLCAAASTAFAQDLTQQTELPVVSIEVPDAQSSEPGPGTDQAAFLFRRTGSTNADLQVHFVISGSASNGVDYATISNSITFPAGRDSVELIIDPLDDLLPDGRETVRLRLTYGSWTYALQNTGILFPPGYVFSFPSEDLVYIADNDGGPTNHPPAISIASPAEGEANLAPPVVLAANTEDPDGQVVRIDFFEGTNNIAVITNLTGSGIFIPYYLLSATTPPAPTIMIDSASPTPLVPVWWFPSWHLWHPEPGDYVLTARATDNDGASTFSSPVPVTITELPIVTIQASDAYATEPGSAFRPATGAFRVLRTGSTTAPLTVYLSVGGTATMSEDYEFIVNGSPVPGPFLSLFNSVTIPAGEQSTELSIIPIRDSIPEETESVVAALSLQPVVPLQPGFPSNFTMSYGIGEPATATVYIRDRNGGPRNRSPRVRLIEPLSGQSFIEGSTIPLLANTTDRESYVWKVEFFAGVRKIGEVQNGFAVAPNEPVAFAFSWNHAPAGSHLLRARATDTQGGIQISPPVRVRIRSTNSQ